MNGSTATRCAVELRSLWRLARFCGVTPSYKNVTGERVRAKPEAVLHALRSYGVDVQSPVDAGRALRDAAAVCERRFIDPVNVLWRRENADPARGSSCVMLHLRREDADARCECGLVLEDGGERAWNVDLSEVPAVEEVEGLLHKPLGLRGPLPVGYHPLEVKVKGRTACSWVFVAPERAREIEQKCWGAFMPLYSVRSEGNWGVGDYSDLHNMCRCIGANGGRLCGTLPLLASSMHINEANVSPYMPTSRLFWNECYIDVEAAPEFAECAEARALVQSRDFREARERLRRSDLVDYAGVMKLKRRVVEAMARQFFGHAPATRRTALDVELKRDPVLAEYAQFIAAGEKSRATWTNWPAASRNGRLDDGHYDEDAKQRQLYAQFLCIEQLSRAANGADANGCGLYLDLPVGVHPEGFDTWRFHDSFVHDASAGAPPDEFFTQGQNWGILPLHPQRTRADGHAYFRHVIARHLRFARALRIDHVMWMHRVYWAPHGMPASEGVYVRYPADEMFAILCVESQRSGVPIVGENLGTVPDAVNRKMDRHGIHPLYVGQFAWTGDAKRPLAKPQKKAVASLNTHDTPTFAEHWFGSDIDRRAALGLLHEDEARDEKAGRENASKAVLEFVRHHRVRLRAAGESDEDVVDIAIALLADLARSDASVILLSLEDLWAERQPQNMPGTNDGKNWRRKAARTLDEIRGDLSTKAAFEKLREVLA